MERLSDVCLDEHQNEWHDCTSFFKRVCEDLETGELVHGEAFSLFEAMSSLEIMDPKMDAGMSTGGFRSSEEAIAGGLAPTDLTVWQIIDVVDQLLACEATWHSGHSLAQTVFTCLYLSHIERTAQIDLLNAFCRAVKASCNCVRTLVCKADVYEEEDFVTASWGLPLDGDVDSKSLTGLSALEEILARQLRASRSGAGRSKAKAEEALQADPKLEEGVCQALLCRLRFRKAFFHALSSMDKREGRGLELAKKHILTATTELAAMRASEAFLVSAVQSQSKTENGSSGPVEAEDWKVAAVETPHPAATSAKPSNHSKSPESDKCPQGDSPLRDEEQFATNGGSGSEGLSPASAGPGRGCSSAEGPASSEPRNDHSASTSADNPEFWGGTASGRPAVGFCASVNRGLLAPSPPRPIKILTWSEALDSFQKLLRELDQICSIPLGATLNELLQWMTEFHEQLPGPIARCRLQLLVVQGKKFFGVEPAEHLLFRSLGLPREVLENDTWLAPFLRRAGVLVLQLVGSYSSNLARQRRKLAKQLSHWNTLIHNADRAGASKVLIKHMKANFPEGWWGESVLVSWTVEMICRILLRYLMLGFDCQLYSPAELCYVYWYMDHVLGKLLHNVAARERAWHHRSSPATAQAGGTASDKRSKHSNKVTKPAANFEASNDMVALNCQLYMCKAYVRMLVAFKEDGKMPERHLPFNSEADRYRQRFAPVWRASIPEPMDYCAFREGTSMAGLQVADLYQLSFDLFQTASAQLRTLQQGIEREAMSAFSKEQRLRQVALMERATSRNCMAIRVAHSAGPGPCLKVSLEYSAHVAFPVAVVKRS